MRVFLILFGLIFALQVSASLEDVSYPIAELGSCASQDECFSYCERSENFDVCMSFAQSNDLLEDEQIQEYQDAMALIENGGPGGCSDQATCEAYCADIAHLEECLNFAQENGMMEAEELVQAQQVLAAVQAGYELPGGCSSQESCDVYCSDLANMEECLSFAQAAGMMTDEEIEEAKAMMELMASGEMPGGCTSKETCEAYCSQEANQEECSTFFGESEEWEEQAPTDFVGPGGCTSEEECLSYCSQTEHMEECAAFFGDTSYDDDHESTQKESVMEETQREEEYQYEGQETYELYDQHEQNSQFDGSKNTLENFDPGEYELDLEEESFKLLIQ